MNLNSNSFAWYVFCMSAKAFDILCSISQTIILEFAIKNRSLNFIKVMESQMRLRILSDSSKCE